MYRTTHDCFLDLSDDYEVENNLRIKYSFNTRNEDDIDTGIHDTISQTKSRTN